ncbi:hypothetical protein BDW74DRAFT_189258 [Aspergillus multicolor]|uniref:putative C6 transcription factor n=1 Tax=Aspergillus multicolor TaxID=41759 RepID=UPI003CCE4930
MSTPIRKRRRAKKACGPCRQRKRKCDTTYPCGMCATYGYSCTYDSEAATDTMAGGFHILRSPKRVNYNGEAEGRLSNPPPALATAAPAPAARSPGIRSDTGRGSSMQSPAGAAAAASPGIFDPQKFRHAGASAAMAFPHVLGVALGSDSPPRARSFAYNFGIRPEEASNAHCFLGDIISEEDLAFFSGVYFSVLGPIGDVMDPQIYAQRCREYYQTLGSNRHAVAFAAVAAGIAALGSFLSGNNRHPRESDLVSYARAILDDPAVMYLRATTRPSNAWIASCTQMHLCEAIGLHQDANIQKMAATHGAAALGHNADRLRRIFWISWAGHIMLSYEYDRSPVQFGSVTWGSIDAAPGSIADQFVQLIQIIPSPNSPFQLEGPSETSSPSSELLKRFKALDTFATTHPFLLVTKAEIAFAFYRRLYTLKIQIPDSALKTLISAGNAAVGAATHQASEGWLFWNVIGSVFQYACILLAVDTPVASAHIGAVLRGLEDLVQVADTPLTREALSMARHLLSLSKAKKRRELEVLEGVEAGYSFFPGQGREVVEVGMDAVSVLDVDGELNWDQFFIEPFFALPWPDVQM